MSKRKEILVPGTSLVGLKAELLKKTQEFQVEKDGGGSSSIAGTAASHGKVISEEGVVLGGPKFKVKNIHHSLLSHSNQVCLLFQISKTTPAATANRNNGQTRGGSRRGSTSLQSNNEDETLETPGHVLEASWIALQRKAKEYEKLKKTALQGGLEGGSGPAYTVQLVGYTHHHHIRRR